MKKTTRIIAGLTTAGLLGLTPLAVSAPANAENEGSTVSSFTVSKTSVVHGETVSFSGNVVGPDGSSVVAGTATLYELSSKTGAWAPIAIDETPGYLSFYDIQPANNAQYKVLYSGGAAYGNTYVPSESAPVAVSVSRKITVSGSKKRSTIAKIKVGPDAKKLKVKIVRSKKVNGKYKKFRTIKLNKKGKTKVKLPAPRKIGQRIYFKFVVKGSTHYAGSTYGPVYTYRGYGRAAVR